MNTAFASGLGNTGAAGWKVREAGLPAPGTSALGSGHRGRQPAWASPILAFTGTVSSYRKHEELGDSLEVLFKWLRTVPRPQPPHPHACIPGSWNLLFFLQPRVSPGPKGFGMVLQRGCQWEEVSLEPPRMAVIDPSKIRGYRMPHCSDRGETPAPSPSGQSQIWGVLTRRPCWALLSCLAPVTFGAWGTCRSWRSRLPRGPWGENEMSPEKTVGLATTEGLQA